MIIKYGNTDITELLLEYKRQGSIDIDNIFLLGNTPSYELDLKIDNSSHILETLSGEIQEFNDANVLKGTYIVYESPKKYTDVVELICFDKMLLTNIPYDSKLYYPATIKDQLNEIGQITGLSIISSNIPADILYQEVNFWDNTLSCRDYIGWIAEISGMNAACNANGNIVFKTLSTTYDWKTEDVESYTVDEIFTISRICFDNGLLKLEQGNTTGNTLYLSSNNPYIDTEHNPVEKIYRMYNGWKCVSLEDMKAASLDDLKLFDVIEFQSQKFVCLDVESIFHGGQFQIQNIKGKLSTKNAEKVTIKYDNSIKIKKLQILIDQNKNQLNIIANEHDELNSKYANLEVSLSGINGTVSSMQTNIDSMEQRIYTTEQKQTAHAITTTISRAMNNGEEIISTTKFIMNSSGLHIKNGGFDISNNAGTKVLYADTYGNLNLTGTITGSKINGGSLNGTEIQTKYIYVKDGSNITIINSEGFNTTYFVCSGAGQVNKHFNVGELMTCQEIGLWNGVGSSIKGLIQYSGSHLEIRNSKTNGKVRVLGVNNQYLVGVEILPVSNDSNYGAFFRPIDNANTTLGTTYMRWYRYYGANGDSISSDKRLKSNIQDISSYDVQFNLLTTTQENSVSTNLFEQIFSDLNPKTYYMNQFKKDKLHIGFVAQDIVATLNKFGCSEEDLDLIQHDKWADEETGEQKEQYSLVYNDIIALNTYMIQKCMKRIDELEKRLSM